MRLQNQDPGLEPAPVAIVSTRLTSEEIAILFQRLTAEEVTCLTLRYLKHWQLTKIARLQHCSVSTVQRDIAHARQILTPANSP